VSEETAKKKTRRAARRAAQEGSESAPASKAKADDTSERPAKRSSDSARSSEGGAANVRKERLRAREVAAAKRRKARDKERAHAAAEGLDTSELVDDALARGAHATSRFVQQNFKWLQWLIVLGIAGGFGKLIYDYRTELGNQKGSKLLMQGLEAQLGKVKNDTDLDSQVAGFEDTRKEFDSDAARLKAAAESYRKAIDDDPKAERQLLARMGLAGVLFDQAKYADAAREYTQVQGSSVAGSDQQLKGRATEGLALSLEALGKKDEASKAFKELENLGGAFGELGKYHRARLLYQDGKRDEAKDLLKKVVEKAEKEPAGPFGNTGFVGLAARQLLEVIDPSAAKAPASGLTPEQLKKIQEQIKKAAGVEGGGADMKELMEQINKQMGDAPAELPPPPAGEAKDAPPAPKPVAPQGAATPTAPSKAPVPPKVHVVPKPAPAPAAPAAPAPAAPAPVAPAPVAPAPPAAPTPAPESAP
jgi:tetratricopeptide (TPR) repeat protein